MCYNINYREKIKRKKERKMKRHSIENVPVYLKVAQDLRLNIALCSAHGRAKTATIKKYAEDNELELITLILSRLLPEDTLGLPTIKTDEKGNKVTTYSEPDWLVKAGDPDKKVLLFFDEFNNGEMDVQAAILNLIEDRKMGEVKLADTTQIVMAFNPTSIAPNAKELSKATRDRICVIPIEDNRIAYSNYYSENDMDTLTNIMAKMPEIIPNHDNEVVDAALENAEFTYRSLEKAYKICEYCTTNNIDRPAMIDMVCGYGGSSGEEFVTAYEAESKTAGNSSAIMKALKDYQDNNGTVDDFIKEVKNNRLLDEYESFPDLRSIVNKIQNKLSEKDFHKFLDKCLTQEFRSVYAMETGMSDLD